MGSGCPFSTIPIIPGHVVATGKSLVAVSKTGIDRRHRFPAKRGERPGVQQEQQRRTGANQDFSFHTYGIKRLKSSIAFCLNTSRLVNIHGLFKNTIIFITKKRLPHPSWQPLHQHQSAGTDSCLWIDYGRLKTSVPYKASCSVDPGSYSNESPAIGRIPPQGIHCVQYT